MVIKDATAAEAARQIRLALEACAAGESTAAAKMVDALGYALNVLSPPTTDGGETGDGRPLLRIA